MTPQEEFFAKAREASGAEPRKQSAMNSGRNRNIILSIVVVLLVFVILRAWALYETDKAEDEANKRNAEYIDSLKRSREILEGKRR